MHVIVAVTIMSIVYMQSMHGADAEQDTANRTVMVAPQQVLPPSPYPWSETQVEQFLQEYNPSCCCNTPKVPMIPLPDAYSCEHCCMNSIAWLMNHGCRITSCCQATAAVTTPVSCGMSGVFFLCGLQMMTNGSLSGMAIPTMSQVTAIFAPTTCCLCVALMTLCMSHKHSICCFRQREPYTYSWDHRIVRSLIRYNNRLASEL